jgi:aldose 1-epimerase
VTDFSAELLDDHGFEVAVLRAAPGALEARIAPHAGANLFSLQVDGIELLVQPPSLDELAVSPAGTPVLFPMPNRVRDGVFEFEGRRFSFEPNNGPNYIHGLVRRRPWRCAPPEVDAAGASVELAIEWDPSQPDFERFPIGHRLTVRFRLEARRLRIDYRVDNHGPGRLPFGFGLHPWFRVPGAREDVRLEVPAAERMETIDKLPTGRVLGVDGTAFDLRRPASLAGLDLDDVYIGMSAAPSFEWRDPGVRMTFGASAEFTHLVVFTPPERSLFCIENQTSSTDAHNLHARGLVRESHLQIVEEGQVARGSVDWTIERVRESV